MQIFAPLIHFLRLLTELLRAAGIGGEEQECGDCFTQERTPAR